MKDVWTQEEIIPEKRKINIKKVVIIIIAIVVIVIGTVLIGLYQTNRQARSWIDRNIFRKEVLQDKVATIEVNESEAKSIYAFNKYIGILNKTKFSIYGNTGNKEKELDIQISNPIYSSDNRFLAIAENKGQKIYSISDKDISWEASVEGNISQIHINRNGYVAVVIVDTSYKTVIAMYNPNGTPIFKTYLSSRVVDVSISNDNKYLAIAEVDTSGTVIQSNIKIISIDKAEKEKTDSVENAYQSEAGKLITNIKYQDRNRIVCMYTDSIIELENGQAKTLADNQSKKVIYQSLNLNNCVCSVEEKSSGLFTADSLVNLINVENQDKKEYIADSVTREIYTYGDIIALNLGTEVEFINTSGWLVKRYIANQEISNIVVSNNLAGIIYRDKIEIINL